MAVLTPTNSNPPEPRYLSPVPRWEHALVHPHVGLRGYGNTPDEAFAQAALAMMALIVDPHRVEARGAVTLECRAPELPQLLLAWLRAVKTQVQMHDRVFCAFDLNISGHHLHAVAWGESMDVARHCPAADVRGAEFTWPRVGPDRLDTWTAECVLRF